MEYCSGPHQLLVSERIRVIRVGQERGMGMIEMHLEGGVKGLINTFHFCFVFFGFLAFQGWSESAHLDISPVFPPEDPERSTFVLHAVSHLFALHKSDSSGHKPLGGPVQRFQRYNAINVRQLAHSTAYL